MTAQEFIEQNIDLIDTDQFEELYLRGSNAFRRARDMGHVTQLLLQANINPLDHLDLIPDFYLADTSITDFIIPSTINEIGEFAFFKSNLTRIEIPESVSIIGKFAFSECGWLRELNFPSNIRIIEEHMCNDCHQLYKVGLPKNVRSIGHSAFLNCKELQHISFPKTLKYIQTAAFMNCPLIDIYYQGSKEDWFSIDKEKSWIRRENNCIVHCSDGEIKL